MKKKIIIFSGILSISSLTAFGLMSVGKEKPNVSCIPLVNEVEVIVKNKDDANFFYAMGTRFGGVKKGALDKARSITDFLPEEETNPVVTYKSVSAIVIENDLQTELRENSNNEVLTEAQLKLLQSAAYSSNFVIKADFLEKDEYTGELRENYFSHYLTIVPEKEAMYASGKDALIEYLKENNKENIANIDKSKLQAAKLYFTINKNGKLSNLRLDRTSGYATIDEKIIELLHEAPGKWKPAENVAGEKVDQELVISFGMIGC